MLGHHPGRMVAILLALAQVGLAIPPLARAQESGAPESFAQASEPSGQRAQQQHLVPPVTVWIKTSWLFTSLM